MADCLHSVGSQAYIDESGGREHPTFVMGGYAGTAAMWRAFSSDWQAVIDAQPAIPPMHMAYCERGEGEWAALADRDTRERKLLDLAAVIARHRPLSFVVELRTADYLACWHRLLPKRYDRLDHPHAVCAFWIAARLVDLQSLRGVDLGPVDLLFDWHEQCGRRTRDAIEEATRPFLQAHAPKKAHLLGATRWIPRADRASHVPLQAADLLVWHWRRAISEPDGEHRPVFKALMAASDGSVFRIQRRGLWEWVSRGYDWSFSDLPAARLL